MKKTLMTGLVLAAGLALAGTTAHAEDLLIGVAGPLTGNNAAFGAQLQKGAEQAAADINAAGGIDGKKIVLKVQDDAGDPKQGPSVANALIGDGVTFVVGHFNSGVSIPASEVYADNGVFQITPASTNPTFTERGLWNTFRTCGRDDQQGPFQAAWILEKFPGKNIAIIDDKTQYGAGLAEEMKKALNAGGLTEVVRDSINVGDKDFSALISKMKAANVDLIYFGGLHTEAGLIVRQAEQQGLKAPMLSGDGITSAEFAAIAGPAAEGTLMTFPPDPRVDPKNAELIKKFRDAGFEPEAYTLYAYAAMQVIAAGIKAAKSEDPQKVAEAIHSGITINTVLGDISYDSKGDVKAPGFARYVWEKGADGKINYVQIQ